MAMAARASPINFWGNTPEEVYYEQQGIESTKSYHISPRGQALFTRSWKPLPSISPCAIIFMVHGYGSDISWTFQATPIFLAQNGFACFALDLQGHGHSEGLKAYVPDFDIVVDDCLSFFDSVLIQEPLFRDLPRFLYGESMGGAISLLIQFKKPKFFTGAVLIAPMCKRPEKRQPKWPIASIFVVIARVLGVAARIFPTLPIVPMASLLDKSVKVPEKKIIGAMNPLRYQGKQRLGTVFELVRVADYVSRKLRDVEIPFLVMHGSADLVTDPDVSRELYEKAKSEDKSIKIYEGMMHSFLSGEPDENIATVRGDILQWLNARC